MPQTFDIEVVHPNQQPKKYRATVAGGTHSAESLGEHYQHFNLFPGAQEVKISQPREMEDNRTVKERIDAAIAEAGRSSIRPKLTPKATILPPLTTEEAAGAVEPKPVVEQEPEVRQAVRKQKSE